MSVFLRLSKPPQNGELTSLYENFNELEKSSSKEGWPGIIQRSREIASELTDQKARSWVWNLGARAVINGGGEIDEARDFLKRVVDESDPLSDERAQTFLLQAFVNARKAIELPISTYGHSACFNAAEQGYNVLIRLAQTHPFVSKEVCARAHLGLAMLYTQVADHKDITKSSEEASKAEKLFKESEDAEGVKEARKFINTDISDRQV